jgi:hypothetical protein
LEPSEILALLGTDTPPTDEELVKAYDDFGVELANAVENRLVTEAKNIREARQLIWSEQEKRAEQKAEEDAELAALAADLQTEEEPPEEDEEEPEEETTEASLDLAAIRQASRNARSRISAEAAVENPHPHVRVRSLGSVEVGADATIAQLGELFSRFGHMKDSGRHTLMSMEWDIPKERRLEKDVAQSTRLINSVLTPESVQYEAIAAAGGICGPLEAVYSIPNIGSTIRPVRDALTRFGAERGGIRFIPALRPSTDTTSGGVSIWTAENDASPSSPAEKPCPHVDCGQECTATVDAITACLVVGNFMAKFSPEQWSNLLWDLSVQHARVAEQALLAGIDAGSVAATFGPTSGTIHAVLGAIDRAVAGIRSRERLGDGVGFRAILDGWVRQALRSHFRFQDPEGQTAEATDAVIASWFAARGVSVTYTLDDSVFGAQTAGALNAFPATTDIRVFPEGTWLYLDGGTLDLGTEIVDSELIAVNDREAFMETFEGVAKRTEPCDSPGDDSLTITVTLGEDCICEPAGA